MFFQLAVHNMAMCAMYRHSLQGADVVVAQVQRCKVRLRVRVRVVGWVGLSAHTHGGPSDRRAVCRGSSPCW